MEVTREDLNTCTVQLTVSLATDEVKAAFERSFKQAAKTIKIAGFRPGHAPRAMVEKMINYSSLYDGTADHLVRSTLQKAIEESKLEPDLNTRPRVDLKSLNHEENTCEYVAKIPLPAKIELGEYQGLELDKGSEEVTDEEVDYQIEEIRSRRATQAPITDRGLTDGDVAVLNIKVDGAKGDGRNFMTVVGQTFPALDEAIRGMKVEDMKHLELTFPGNFQEKDWANSTEKCTVTLNSASAVKAPALDDSFAKSLKIDSVDELKSRVREQVAQAKSQMIRDIMIEQAMDKLLAASTVEVSDNSWEDIANRRMQETYEEQQQAGKTIEEYAAENGMTLDELEAAWKEKAKLYIKRAFLMREIFVKEQMQLTNQDLNLELAMMSQEYDVDPKEMATLLEKNNALEELRFRAVSRKVTDFLLATAKVGEAAATAPEKEKAAKAKPAKEEAAKPEAKAAKPKAAKAPKA